MTGIPKIVLVTQCIKELTRPTKDCPSPPDLVTPWLRVLTFFETLPLSSTPNISIVAVDCVPSKQNRVKIYCRSPLTTLTNLRRFITLGRSSASLSAGSDSPLKRGLDQITLLWYLLFPDMANSEYDNSEPAMRDPSHPTAGLLFYYELRGGHPEPFPKVYIPVRHLCRSDRHIVKALTQFYRRTGNIKAGMRYARDVQEILWVSCLYLIDRRNILLTAFFVPPFFLEVHIAGCPVALGFTHTSRSLSKSATLKWQATSIPNATPQSIRKKHSHIDFSPNLLKPPSPPPLFLLNSSFWHSIQFSYRHTLTSTTLILAQSPALSPPHLDQTKPNFT